MTINTFASGLTIFLLRSVFGKVGTWTDTRIVGLEPIEIPLIKDIPVLGDILSGYSLFVYVSWILVFAVWFFLYRTPYGFWVRAAGEHPEALETAGISPVRMKVISSVLCGIFCGFAGAHLALGFLNCFYRRYERKQRIYRICLRGIRVWQILRRCSVRAALRFPAGFGNENAVPGRTERSDFGSTISGNRFNAGLHYGNGNGKKREAERRRLWNGWKHRDKVIAL